MNLAKFNWAFSKISCNLFGVRSKLSVSFPIIFGPKPKKRLRDSWTGGKIGKFSCTPIGVPTECCETIECWRGSSSMKNNQSSSILFGRRIWENWGRLLRSSTASSSTWRSKFRSMRSGMKPSWGKTTLRHFDLFVNLLTRWNYKVTRHNNIVRSRDMNPNTTAIQYMGMIMRLEELNINYVLSLVEIVNNSYLSAKDVVTILEEIFKNEKSAKILLATQILEYLVKNSNRNFHQAANKESFQKSVLGLLKRVSMGVCSKGGKWTSWRNYVQIPKTGVALNLESCIWSSFGTMPSFWRKASTPISSTTTRSSGNRTLCFLPATSTSDHSSQSKLSPPSSTTFKPSQVRLGA